MDEAEIRAVEALTGHVFADKTLLVRAMRHASLGSDNNKAMATLGDRIFSAWVARSVFARSPESSMEDLTLQINAIIAGPAQAHAFRELGLAPHLKSVGFGADAPDSMHATALEALVAAIELDAHQHAAASFVARALSASGLQPTAAGRDDLKALLVAAIGDLERLDTHLLQTRASERATTHRLALHIERRLVGNWDVDCEYNRTLSGIKRVAVADGPSRVFPDIVVHRRGSSDHNLLAIEVKHSASRAQRDRDVAKLVRYREQLGYRHAFFVNLKFVRAAIGPSRIDRIYSA